MNFQASISVLLYKRCLSIHIHMAAMTPPIIGIIGIIGSAWQCNAMQ
jgi:hypothetical protein